MRTLIIAAVLTIAVIFAMNVSQSFKTGFNAREQAALSIAD